MRKLVLPLAAALAVTLCVRFAPAADEGGKEKKITGVLVDSHCAEKFTDQKNPEKAAAKHSAACCVKCAKGGADLVLLHGKDQLKLDKHGQELAMAYLAKEKAKTRVTVTGEREGDEIKVSSINAAETK